MDEQLDEARYLKRQDKVHHPFHDDPASGLKANVISADEPHSGQTGRRAATGHRGRRSGPQSGREAGIAARNETSETEWP
jgi:hypothetical protein